METKVCSKEENDKMKLEELGQELKDKLKIPEEFEVDVKKTE